MPAVRVSLPAPLTSPDPPAILYCEAGTVAEALQAVKAQVPRFGERIFFGERLLVTVALNGRQLAPRAALATTLAADDVLEIVPPVAGG